MCKELIEQSLCILLLACCQNWLREQIIFYVYTNGCVVVTVVHFVIQAL